MIKIKDIPESGLALEVPLGRALLKDALAGLDADLERSRAEAKVALTRTGEDVFLRGRVAGVVLVPCARCLRDVETRVEAPLTIVFSPEGEARPDEEPAEDEVDRAAHDGHAIELDDVLREALILAVPMAPLCRADCKGLCPVCGGDRNERDCGCNPKFEDPRLAPLKALKQ